MARFLLSKSKVIEQFESIKGLGLISYSFKTNPLVGQLLENETDCLFSVHFINELRLIKDKSRVWFLAQALNQELLGKLFSIGVRKYVIENLEDLGLLLDYLAEKDENIELLLRMKLKENTIKTERYYVFGMESEIVNRKIIELNHDKHITKIGIHMHRKTQNVSEWDLAHELSEIIPGEVLQSIDYLNIGGGLPVMYKNISDKVIPSVIQKIEQLKSWLSDNHVELMIEPGRYISGPAITLESEIIGIHGNTIVVDASVYNASPDTLIVPIKLLVEGEVDEGMDSKQYIIKGITPCSTDIFRYRVYFPKEKEIKIGGKIIFLNAGAYNFHTAFCELDKIITDVVE